MPRRTSLVSFEACAGYLDHCRKEPDQVRCLALRDGAGDPGHLRAGTADRAAGWVPPRRLGRALAERASIYADVVGPDDAARRVFVPMLAGYLRRHPEGRWLLALGPLEVGAALWEGADRLARADRCVDRTDPVRILDCREPYAQVEAGCSNKHRRALKVARKHLAELPGDGVPGGAWAPGPGRGAAGVPGCGGLRLEGRGRERRPRSPRPGQAAIPDWPMPWPGSTDYCEIHSLYTGGRCIASALTTRTGATFSVLEDRL